MGPGSGFARDLRHLMTRTIDVRGLYSSAVRENCLSCWESVARVRSVLCRLPRRPPRNSKCASVSGRSLLAWELAAREVARRTLWAAARALSQIPGTIEGYNGANSGLTRARRMAKNVIGYAG